MTIRVLIADDHAVIRDGLGALLDAHDDIEVVAMVGNGRSAVELAEKEKPDVVILDIAMPGLNGIEAARKIHPLGNVKTLMLSMFGSAEHVHTALQAGASGYVLKEAAGKEVVSAIRALAKGERYFCKRVSKLLAADTATNKRSPLETLTGREREILQLTVEGLSSVKIGERLGLSSKTVDTYRYRAMQKLRVTDYASLIRFAVAHGLTPALPSESSIENT